MTILAKASRFVRAAMLFCAAFAVHGANAALLIGNTTTNSIVRFDEVTGATTTFVTSGASGLVNPQTMVYGPDGNLYVGSGTATAGQILRFNGQTGAFIDRFDQGGSLFAPSGLAFGPDGRLYVASDRSDRILRYEGTTGAYIDVFASGNGTVAGLLNGPVDLRFGPDGNLYVATRGSVADLTTGDLQFDFESQVLRYNTATGAGAVFVPQPSPTPGSFGFVAFQGLAFAPDGRLWTTDFANGIRVYDSSGTLALTANTDYTGTPVSNNFIGNLAFLGGDAYVVGFDFTASNVGSILRFSGTGAPLPGFGNTGALVSLDNAALTRPIPIVAVPFAAVPEPGTLALLGMALAGVLAARGRSARAR